MIGDVLSSTQGTAGRPAGSSKVPLEVALDKFVAYRAEVRAAHKLHETRAGYRAKIGLSDQGLRDYLKHANLPWPLLPADDSLLVCLIWGRPPYDITWANDALCRALHRSHEDLVGNGCALPVLRGHAATLSAEHATLIRRLRADPEYNELDNLSTELLRADGKWQPIEAYVRYTGPKHDRFYCVARMTAPALAPVSKSDTYNVDERYTYRIDQASPLQLIANPPPPGQFVLDHNPSGQLFVGPTPSITFNPQTSTIKLESVANVSHFVIHNPQGRR